MAAIRIFGVHRTWEDWIGIIVGALIVISSWRVNAFDSQFVVMNAVIVGVLVLSLAGMEIVVL
jgi:SPW repeat